MNQTQQVVTQNRSLHELHCDLARHTISRLAELGKDTAWLTFATRDGDRYHMIEGKEEQWDTLYKIAQEVSGIHSSFRMGQVVDQLCELVNTRVSDLIKQNGLKRHFALTNEEVVYSQKLLINLVGDDGYVPNHPWFLRTSETETGWIAKNITSGQKVTVKRKEIKENLVYLIALNMT